MKVLISLLMTGFVALSCTLNGQTNTSLIVFIQDGRSISQDFKRNALPAIKKMARQNDLKVKILDASEGAPIEVAYTPAIFYKQNGNNTLFQGRYSDMEALENFVKSAGDTQPSAKNGQSTPTLTWEVGRATMKTTMKIFPLAGTPPKAKKFDVKAFEKESMMALLQGMEYFRPNGTGAQKLTAKSYHMEFYPTVNRKEGVLLVQMKLYSAFDTAPIFETVIPSGSGWQEWEMAFTKAGNRLEKALIAQISNWDNGDGFDKLNASTPVHSWTETMKHTFPDEPSFIEKGIVDLVSDKE